jgi:hypothetical protein
MYSTMTKLFFLYINPTVINEVTHLAKNPVKQYIQKHPSEEKNFTHSVLETLESGIVSGIRDLIEQEILYVLDGKS